MLLLAEKADAAPVSIVDTILDLGVYALLLGVVSLTIYSLYVTLDANNKKYGGWAVGEDQEVGSPIDTQNTSGRLRSGAVYDPVTEQWTYPEKNAASPRVGRAPVSTKEDGNRYERRMEKRRKQQAKSKRRR